MSLLGLLVVAIVVGVAVYLLQTLPMDATIKRIITVVVMMILVVYVIVFLAGVAGLSTAPLRIR